MVTGRLDDVHKLGDRWRAELIVGSARLPIVGQAGAGIPFDRVIEGRTATVVGIVRAAYPSASDKRASILPRSTADLQVGAATTAPAGAGTATTVDAVGSAAGRPRRAASGPVTSSDPSIPDADLAELAAYEDRVVRVGGSVMDLTADGFTLDDGTAVGTVVVTGEAAAQLPLVEPGDVVNVIGAVTRTDAGWIVSASAADAIGRASSPIDAPNDGAAVPGAGGSSASGSVGLAGFDVQGTGSTGLVGLASLVALSLLSVGATFTVRRHRARLALAGRISRRLAMVAQPAPQHPTLGSEPATLAMSSVAEHDPRLPDSA